MGYRDHREAVTMLRGRSSRVSSRNINRNPARELPGNLPVSLAAWCPVTDRATCSHPSLEGSAECRGSVPCGGPPRAGCWLRPERLPRLPREPPAQAQEGQILVVAPRPLACHTGPACRPRELCLIALAGARLPGLMGLEGLTGEGAGGGAHAGAQSFAQAGPWGHRAPEPTEVSRGASAALAP